MQHRIIRNVFTLTAIVVVTSAMACSQTSDSLEVPAVNPGNSWQDALGLGAAKHKIFVVTVDKPDRKQECHIQSFTPDKLVCSRAIGGPRTFLKQQVVAIILPGEGGLRAKILLGLSGGIGAAVWGTVVLAAACPACAVGTGIAALLLFCAAGAIGFGDYQLDRLLYLAPGQELNKKLGYVER
jgi:hypothetical protein